MQLVIIGKGPPPSPPPSPPPTPPPELRITSAPDDPPAPVARKRRRRPRRSRNRPSPPVDLGHQTNSAQTDGNESGSSSLVGPMQGLRLRFALYKMKREGLLDNADVDEMCLRNIELVEHVRLKCLQSLLARFEETRIDKLIDLIREMYRRKLLEEWRRTYLAVLFEHTTRARRCINRLAESESSTSSPTRSNETEVDKYTISLIAILQLAELWNPEEFKWYTEDCERGRFVEAISKRVRVFDHK
ncbi:hypothetical protein Dda_1996 [Drechslerella dactyloides]|uniref:Uncharacterized protein n=1 Tax=Drechslerella dactyloides TaxID=74499 RepID=A0AAD6J2W9_DREDA|nr:hypothetical protein Dda_1996 [Drechslerella dactyloides]